MLVRTPRILWMNLSILRSSTGCEVFAVSNGVRFQWCTFPMVYVPNGVGARFISPRDYAKVTATMPDVVPTKR
jgi:hypothetical protein